MGKMVRQFKRDFALSRAINLFFTTQSFYNMTDCFFHLLSFTGKDGRDGLNGDIFSYFRYCTYTTENAPSHENNVAFF